MIRIPTFIVVGASLGLGGPAFSEASTRPLHSPQESASLSRPTPVRMVELEKIRKSLGPDDVILDVRTPEEFEEGHVPGAINISHENVSRHLPQLARYERIYVHCQSGKRARKAYDELVRAGLKDVILVKDSGMKDWRAEGLPEEKGK